MLQRYQRRGCQCSVSARPTCGMSDRQLRAGDRLAANCSPFSPTVGRGSSRWSASPCRCCQERCANSLLWTSPKIARDALSPALVLLDGRVGGAGAHAQISGRPTWPCWCVSEPPAIPPAARARPQCATKMIVGTDDDRRPDATSDAAREESRWNTGQHAGMAMAPAKEPKAAQLWRTHQPVSKARTDPTPEHR